MAGYHEQCDQKNKEILIDLADNSPNESTKEIILSYDVDKDESEIYKAMDKKYKGQLAEAADYLRIDVTQMLKDDIIKSILSKLNASLLEFCGKCSIYYHVNIDAEAITICACGQHCHYACYKDLGDVFKNYPGVVFKCSHCSDIARNTKQRKTAKSSTELTKAAEESKQPKEKSQQENDSEPAPIVEKPGFKVKVVESFNLEFLQARYPQTSYDTCEQYKRFNCPHGKNGLTEVNGEICNKLHPKKCFRWIGAGKDEVRGCTKGSECSYYHPILCRNSLRYRKCTNPQCTFSHLKGTKRYNTKDDESNRTNNSHRNHEQPERRANNNHHGLHDRERQTSNNHNVQQDPWATSEAQATNPMKSFLEELIQSLKQDMRNTQEEMREFKTSISTQVAQIQPQHIWQYPAAFNPNTAPNPLQTQVIQTEQQAPPHQLVYQQPAAFRPPQQGHSQ